MRSCPQRLGEYGRAARPQQAAKGCAQPRQRKEMMLLAPAGDPRTTRLDVRREHQTIRGHCADCAEHVFLLA